MKIKDIVVESNDYTKNQKAAMKGVTRTGRDNGPKNPYDKYRLGVMMATSPDGEHATKHGPSRDDLVMVHFSDADHEISDKAHKLMGYKKKKVSSNTSHEEDVHKTSPVAGQKRNKYGI